jgi:outer membrane protein assembly factor BamB
MIKGDFSPLRKCETRGVVWSPLGKRGLSDPPSKGMSSPLIVFVCGTYSDLGEERGDVLDAIQRLQLQHVSMEFFGARPERPIETCLAEVRRSDVLVVIVGHRYGTLVPECGISYSEAEYEEGYRLKKPCLVYIRNEDQTPTEPLEPDPERDRLLKRWKATLKGRHTPAFFRQSSKLAVQVAVDLSRCVRELEEAARTRKPAPEATPAQPRIRVRSCQRFGDEARQLLHGLTIDGQGNIIIVGDFWGSMEFGKSKLTSAGDRDIFVTKFDREGNHIWSQRYGDRLEQVGVGVDTDTTGAVFLVSAFNGTLEFGGDPLVSSGRYNVALARLDQDGRHVWSSCFGDNRYHVPECIAVAPTGRIVIAGRFAGSIDFGGGRIESQSEQTDIFLAAFSSDGENLWAKRFGGPYEQQTRSLAIDANGNIVLTGVFKGAIDFDGQALSEAQPKDYCGFLSKLDERGSTLWCKRFGEPSAEQGSVVVFDRSNGDVVVAGFIRNKLPPEVSGKMGAVCLFARYDAAGVLRWSKAFGTHVFPDSLAVAPDGRILLTGHFENAVDFGLGPLESAGGYDLFAAMFTSDGSALWSRRFGDPRQQFLIKGAHGHNQSIVLAGSFHGSIDFGAGALVAAGYDGTKEGTEDVFLAILEDSSRS